MTLTALGLSGEPVHEPVHGPNLLPPRLLLLRVTLQGAVYKKYGHMHHMRYLHK